jgi:dTDP-4-dehydrorhamnose reductase
MNSYLPKILITGSHGQLGTALRQHPRSADFQLVDCPKTSLDICDPLLLETAISKHAPDIVVNTAAYTAVDKAEQEREQCNRVNHLGARNLAAICAKLRIPLLHISTDYVFSGEQTIPYLETNAPNPVNYYGTSKWLGEEAVREACAQHIILRVSGLFSEHGSCFPKTILRLARDRKELRVVSDQVTCPTSCHDIAGAIYTMTKNPVWGTYHYCSSQPVSWHQFALAVVNVARQYQALPAETITAIHTADYPTAAKRPAYSVLDCSKIEQDYAIRQPSWEEALAIVIPRL